MHTYICDTCGCAFNFFSQHGCKINADGVHAGKLLPPAPKFPHKPEGDTFFEIPGKVFDSLEEAAFGRQLTAVERAVKIDRLEAEQESFIPDPLNIDGGD